MEDNTHPNTDSVTIETVRSEGNIIGGRLEMSADVVATIAGIAARQVSGVHKLGKSRLISFGKDPARGVDAEVGTLEAALDLEVVIDYGSNIREVAAMLRKKIAEEVDQMAGRRVVEVNLSVVGIQVPEEKGEDPERRIR